MTEKENMLRVINHDHPGWVPNGLEASSWIISPVIEHPMLGGYDIWGCKWAYDGSLGGSYPDHTEILLKDITEYKNVVKKPDIRSLDWSQAEAVAASVDRENNIVIGFVEMGIFERLYILMGMEDALVNYLLEPELMYELAGIIADYKIEYIRMYKEKCNPDMIAYGDDWGTQEDLFIPEELWRQIIKPHTKRIYDEIKNLGMMINQHSCGKIERVFGDMVEMGADIYNPCQPCNDLAMLKKKYGDKITFQGGIDSQFILDNPLATMDDIEKEVKLRIDQMAEGGGYIAQPSHAVRYSQDKMDKMESVIKSYGRNFYNKTR